MKGVPVRSLFVHFFPINSSLFGTRIAISKIHPCVLLGFSLSSYLSETESLTSISWPTSKATKNIPGFGIRRIHSAEKKKRSNIQPHCVLLLSFHQINRRYNGFAASGSALQRKEQSGVFKSCFYEYFNVCKKI